MKKIVPDPPVSPPSSRRNPAHDLANHRLRHALAAAAGSGQGNSFLPGTHQEPCQRHCCRLVSKHCLIGLVTFCHPSSRGGGRFTSQSLVDRSNRTLEPDH
ncbi:hypothetical protein C3L29_006065 [Pseudomonas sp. MWU12-2534b]|nr:hypothetical protein C3L29_006065 [Pseudomonas sp. MWU12-2534b]